MGNVGLLIAHSLAGIPNRPPITFLVRTGPSMRSFWESGRCVELITDGISEKRRGFEAEIAHKDAEAFAAKSSMRRDPGQTYTHSTDGSADDVPTNEVYSVDETVGPTDAPTVGTTNTSPNGTEIDVNQEISDGGAMRDEIDQDANDMYYDPDDRSIITNLIVSVKAKDILALHSVAHRLTKDSAILFVQNGMGYIDEVNEKIFPNPETRPNYIIGVVSHGAKRLKAYTVAHAGHGTIALSILPRSKEAPAQLFPPSARYLLRTITRTPVLAAVAYHPTDLLQIQLEKLAINCVINPLTAIMDCANGELLTNYHSTRVMRLLLAEVSLVIRSLPELQDIPNVQSRFDPGRLELDTIRVASSTAVNLSSMLQDVRAGKETEIDFVNGYIIRRGEELGIRCIMNYMIMHLLEAKQKIVDRNDSERLPIGSEDSLEIHSPT